MSTAGEIAWQVRYELTEGVTARVLRRVAGDPRAGCRRDLFVRSGVMTDRHSNVDAVALDDLVAGDPPVPAEFSPAGVSALGEVRLVIYGRSGPTVDAVDGPSSIALGEVILAM